MKSTCVTLNGMPQGAEMGPRLSIILLVDTAGVATIPSYCPLGGFGVCNEE